MKIQLRVIGPNKEEKIIGLCHSDQELKKITVTQLMDKISHELNMRTEEIRIVFRTTQLEETSLVLSYGIRHMSTIHILLRLPGGI